MTEITQADRDAAARAWAEDNDEPLDCHICEQIRAGYGDNSLDVIRFARHRMEATEALSAENERLREALMLCAKHADWMPHPHCVEVETAIRAALGDTK